jgi:hypothetical protein
MSEANVMPSPTPNGRVPPVRVRLSRADAYTLQRQPPDGDAENWWRRLSKALGTMSSDFVNASLLQLQAAGTFAFRHRVGDVRQRRSCNDRSRRTQRQGRSRAARSDACTHTAAMSVLAKPIAVSEQIGELRLSDRPQRAS